MKVLFALSNDSVTEAIVKNYQKQYKEIISYKNVYYFNAILREIQKDKTYDRIVISEDLEPFANNNYDTIDKFLFEKLDSISDEASNGNGNDIPIILICTDRRTKSESLLVKLFGIGIYNALLGQDRSVEEVCKLIQKPRIKKEAKIYYKIESEDVNYESESEDNVSEVEIQNIIAHYKKLGKNEAKYVESFNNIASQYTNEQLKVIIKFLPLNVKAVLEGQSPRYQEIMAFSGESQSKKVISNTNTKTSKKRKLPKPEELKIDILEKNPAEPISNVIVPSVLDSDNVKKTKKTTTKKVKEEKQEEQEEIKVETPKKTRGRPKKVVEPVAEAEPEAPKKTRGRPKKKVMESEPVKEEEVKPINLYDLLDDEDELGLESGNELRDDMDNSLELSEQDNYNMNSNFDINTLLTSDKKVVTFVGTTKNGTSFLVNNIALMLAKMGIKTAILDVTENKNSYYIYTKNEEKLRKIAFESIGKLRRGVAEGVQVDKNLTVYTSLPGNKGEYEDVKNILSTLVRNYTLVLIDADFNTPIQYFANSQEIYLVQSMDILTIQPLTAFLRDIKSNNILIKEKIKIVLNKTLKVRSLSEKAIIGGMSFYNDPAMSFMTELFNKDTVKHFSIPFEPENYSKYLEALVNCNITINGYTKNLVTSLKELANSVYPLLGKTNSKSYAPTYRNFSSSMDNTLKQMKNRY